MDITTWEGESVITCKYCEVEKEESSMAVRGGKPSKVCIECKENRAGLGAGAPKKKKARRKREPADELRMTVPGGGHGFDAFITEDGAMQVTQENPGSEADNVVLTRHEAQSLRTMIDLWLKRPAEA